MVQFVTERSVILRVLLVDSGRSCDWTTVDIYGLVRLLTLAEENKIKEIPRIHYRRQIIRVGLRPLVCPYSLPLRPHTSCLASASCLPACLTLLYRDTAQKLTTRPNLSFLIPVALLGAYLAWRLFLA